MLTSGGDNTGNTCRFRLTKQGSAALRSTDFLLLRIPRPQRQQQPGLASTRDDPASVVPLLLAAQMSEKCLRTRDDGSEDRTVAE